MGKTELEKLVADGLSVAKIGKCVGKSNNTVRYWLNVHGLKTVRSIKTRVYKCACGEVNLKRFLIGRYTSCRKCRAVNQSGRNREWKIKAVAYKGGCCCKCGYSKCLAALDFHHIDSSKKAPNWRSMRSWSFEKVKNELEKCDLLCRNCHQEFHYGE